ncbi:hypothetical protein B0T12DRAFT_164196 [Alternaria alternata]|nr:hypothetical protein B0T12DRAFT_164196 [Alternaria alternata]
MGGWQRSVIDSSAWKPGSPAVRWGYAVIPPTLHQPPSLVPSPGRRAAQHSTAQHTLDDGSCQYAFRYPRKKILDERTHCPSRTVWLARDDSM